jgi:hypothetical protein
MRAIRQMARHFDFDPRLQHPFTCMVCGPTQCGKTQFVIKLIKNSSFINPPPERIIWCYGCYQREFDRLSRVEFVEGIPDESLLDGKRTLIIIDDLMSETDDRVTKLFTRGSHHKNASVVYVSQNLYHKGKENRTINLNSHYLILFKNPRDAGQIVHLGRQIFPNKSKYFADAFADATSHPYGYLLIDLKPTTADELRLRTEVFPEERGFVYVYK